MEELGYETKKDAAKSPEREVRRWLLEIKLALKREKPWREEAKKILEKYRAENAKKNSFNILWANTETMRPALYNSTPKPDVRRRFREEDMLGKAVSEVMERSTTYCVDAYDMDACMQNDVLDALLPGRGVSRVRYVPKFKTVPKEPDTQDDDDQSEGVAEQGLPAAASAEGADADAAEEVDYEQAMCEHVQWDDYLQGAGKTYEEVPWKAYRHRLTKDDITEKFGEDIAKDVKLGDVAEPELEGDNKDIAGVFKRAEFWEIEDKDGKRVFFVNESYKKGLIYALKPDGKPGDGTPPLKLKNFFTSPKPLMLVEDTGSQIPIPLYKLYKEQAAELDSISKRINKIVDACRVRFVFDSSLSELKQLMDAGDNAGIPATQARQWLANGGIDKAIWWMPIDQIAAVLRELYVARDGAKAIIYEITGISDIIRGATNPNETLGAQQLKANSSSLRLQRMQREVQRYVRDLIRLLAEVIGEHFDPQTLSQMTGLQFPTNQQKQEGMLLMQAAKQAQASGQQLPPEMAQKAESLQKMMSMPSWEDVMGVLRSDIQREYRVDVETDSTVAQSLQQDMQGLKEVLGGLVEFWQGVMVPVQSGALSMDAVKAISMSIVRRCRMGTEVEDALEKGMQQPKPQPDPKADAEKQKAQAQQQADAQKLEHEKQVAQQKAAQENAKVQAEAAAKERELQMEAALEARRQEFERQQADRQAQLDASFERFKALLEAQTAKDVAAINADASVKAAREKPATQAVQ